MAKAQFLRLAVIYTEHVILFTASVHTYKWANHFMQSIHFQGPSIGSLNPSLVMAIPLEILNWAEAETKIKMCPQQK